MGDFIEKINMAINFSRQNIEKINNNIKNTSRKATELLNEKNVNTEEYRIEIQKYNYILLKYNHLIEQYNLYIERCHDIRTYEYNGKTYKYIPDFITDDGIVEIKGYYSDKSKSKHMQHPDIKMIFSEDMKIYLDYVIEKYGRNFIKLYE